MKNTYKGNQYALSNKEMAHLLKVWAFILLCLSGLAYSLYQNTFNTPTVEAKEPAVASQAVQDRLGELFSTSTVIVANNVEWTRMKAPRLSDVSAYTSRPQETDASPCIPADGSNICERHAKGEKMVASNCYKLGSKLKIGDTVYTVVDRMNKRYTASCRVDIYMGYDLKSAYTHGVKRLMVTEL